MKVTVVRITILTLAAIAASASCALETATLDFAALRAAVAEDLPPDCVSIGPYDQGGCTCDKCAPWGVNGYLRSARAVAALARKTFPGVSISLSTWRFDAFGPKLGEWKGRVGRDTAQCLVPPTRKYLHPGPEVLRNGAL